MLTIGRFADATGLTAKALRHYDEIGLLAPARVDVDNGYRYDDLHVASQRFIATVLGQGLHPGQPIRIEFVQHHVLARLVWPLAADSGG